MKKFTPAFIVLLLFFSCKHSKKLNEQLNESFANHLMKIDSSAKLDSVHILWNVVATERMGRIIDDSIYRREYMRITDQFERAKQNGNKDSIEFYQYEIDYMEKEIDSVNKSVAFGDTTRKYGYLIGLAYYITKDRKTKIDSMLVILDSTSTMRYTEFIDSSLKQALKEIN